MAMYKVLLVVAVLLMATDGFAAATDESRFNKLWGRSIGPRDKPKVACMCLPTGELGALAYLPVSSPMAYCGVPTFDADGNLDSSTSCGSFVVLPK